MQRKLALGLLLVLLSLVISSCAGATPAATPAAANTPAPAPTLAPAAANTPVPAPGAADVFRFVTVADASEARYRVREQLVNRDLPGDAIGATKDVSGTLTVAADGTLMSAQSRFEI
ncbi:MAG: hypothetical protein WAV70_20100, partial [Anaerolineae bacterium]